MRMDEKTPKARERNQVGRGRRTSLGGFAQTEIFKPKNDQDLLKEIKQQDNPIKSHLLERLEKSMKWYIVVFAEFKKEIPNADGTITEEKRQNYISTQTFQAFNKHDIETDLPTAYKDLFSKFDEQEQQESGWHLSQLIQIEVNTAKSGPLEASSYIELPQQVKNTRGVINIQNKDNMCFIWAVLAHLHPIETHAERVTHYHPFLQELNAEGIEFPTPIHQIPKFEKQNNMSINVFGWEVKEVVPIYISRHSSDTVINLLLISQGDKRHYCLIKNFSRLMAYRTKHDGQQYFCFNCLHGFTAQRLLDKHHEVCNKNKVQKLTFPEDTTIRFKNIAKQQRAPFCIYADFECCTEPHEGDKYQHHKPNSFAYIVISEYEKPDPVLYRGENAVQEFLKCMVRERDRIVEKLNNTQPMALTPEDERDFAEASECYICNEPMGVDKVRDHDHINGKYRGAAHMECNLQYRLRKDQQGKKDSFIIPIFFHNLRGYDSHLIMQEIGKFKDSALKVIPNTMEKYIAFTMDNLKFVDSYQFMGASLEKLAANLSAEGKDKFQHMTSYFQNTAELLLRKGVYPYDYVADPSKFCDTQLPSKDDFYSKLNDQHITDEDYAHAQKVWNVFNCNNFGDYHDIYLKTDVLILADVFENFRNMCLKTYHLDPAHYYTAPGLSWDAMLKLTRVQLELIDDIDMHLMVENGIRGGISMISQRYAKANNSYIQGYDETKPCNYVMYFDANNLYGWAMSQSLPHDGFKWVDEPESIDYMNISEDAETGYILEVDLEYPTELHDDHNDYPLAPEKSTVQINDLSDYSRNFRKELNMKGKGSQKLIPNLRNKEKYVVHYRNLQQYVSYGLKVTKVHRVIMFQQSKWLGEYIILNTDKRKIAKTPFEKDFFKLMNNAIFGKTMENVRKRINVEMVNTEKRFKKTVAKPTFVKFKIFNEDLTAVHCLQASLKLDKAIQVGFSILDLSKTLMYEFHYDYMKKKYPQCRLLFTDTDSLCYDIPTKDIYKDMEQDAELFDTSDYPTDHFLHSEKNKKVLGKMKDECAGIPIEEFVGLRPKMYSMVYGGKEKKTAKGITRACQRRMNHEQYRHSLFNKTQTSVINNIIRSDAHELYSQKVSKVALSPYDDKRYVLDDGLSTLAHGHYRI